MKAPLQTLADLERHNARKILLLFPTRGYLTKQWHLGTKVHLKQRDKDIMWSLVGRENHFHFFWKITFTMAKLVNIDQQFKFQFIYIVATPC